MNLKLLWYCTKSDLKLYKTRDTDYIAMKAKDNIFGYEELNGKIVAVSDYEVEEVTKEISSVVEEWYSKGLLKKSCLNAFELDDYLKGQKGYAIHIKNLHIFGIPKKLREFEKVGSYNNPTIKCKGKERGRCNYGISPFTGKLVGCEKARLTKAPQNMCYAQDIFGNKYVVISVRPQWLAMILNGLKTIEVRRKVLKEML